jgi:hypothetical protein
MRKGRLSKALWTAAIVPLFLAAILPDHVRTLVCRVSGLVMDEEDCCPLVADQTVDTDAQFRDESCCVVRTIDLGRLVSDRRVDTRPIRHCELRAGAPSTSPSPLVNCVAPIRPVAAPAVGPPIVLLKRSFLI